MFHKYNITLNSEYVHDYRDFWRISYDDVQVPEFWLVYIKVIVSIVTASFTGMFGMERMHY